MRTKYLLIDPLSDDPVVITGSANFSQASTVNDDENMLIIWGNKRAADILLCEFMQLFNHFRSRNVLNRQSDEEEAEYSKPVADDSWTGAYYDGGSQSCAERRLFGGGQLE